MTSQNTQSYFYNVDNEWFRRRLFGVMMVVFFAFGILALRLFYLQIIQGDHYFTMSKNNCIRIQRIKPVRGLIFDRNGTLLVENRPSFDLQIIPNDARPVEETIEKAAEVCACVQRWDSAAPVPEENCIWIPAAAFATGYRPGCPGVCLRPPV